MKKIKDSTLRRKARNRYKLKKSAYGKLRLSVFRSGKNIYAQVIDDVKGITVASSSSLTKDISSKLKTGSNIDAAKLVGKNIAEICKKSNIKDVVFDRGTYKYHGRVKALAESAREAGLTI